MAVHRFEHLGDSLDRIHLTSLGSIAYLRATAGRHGPQEVEVVESTNDLIAHCDRVRTDLERVRRHLAKKVSDDYIGRMIPDLSHWKDAGKQDSLGSGIRHFRKPAPS